MSTAAKGTHLIESGWSSGSLVFYEGTVGRTATGDILTIGTTQVTIGGTSQDVDFLIYLGSANNYVKFDAGAATLAIYGVDVTVTGDLTVDTEDINLGDGDDLEFGDSQDVVIRWSTGDADNHSFVIGLGDSNQGMHITDKGAVATDWNIAATTHPTLYIHSNTTPATDYLLLGNHDGTTAHIDVVGGTTLSLDIAGSAEVTLTASALSPATSDGNALGTTSLMWGDLFLASAGVINFNAGDVTLTHGSNALTMAGGAFNVAASGSRYAFTAGTPTFAVYSTNAGVSGATNAEPVVFDTTMTGVGQVGGRVMVLMTHDVTLGGWANALKAKVDCSTNGGASGLLSAACAEMVFPASASKGNTQVIELEAVFPSSGFTTSAAHYTSFIGCNMSGTTATQFDSYGLLLDIEGSTPAATKFISANSQTAKCQIGSNTRYLVFSQAENILYHNVSALGNDDRAAKFYGTAATPAMSDGYGMVEIDATISGTATGWFSPLSSWVNITGSGVAGTGGYICAQTNGVYADSGANTGSTIIFGMRAAALLTDAPAKLCAFSLNTSNRAITAVFDAASAPAIGLVNSSPSSSPNGTIPFVDIGGSIRYIHVYGDAN